MVVVSRLQIKTTTSQEILQKEYRAIRFSSVFSPSKLQAKFTLIFVTRALTSSSYHVDGLQPVFIQTLIMGDEVVVLWVGIMRLGYLYFSLARLRLGTDT
jgi:hypothetical protein